MLRKVADLGLVNAVGQLAATDRHGCGKITVVLHSRIMDKYPRLVDTAKGRSGAYPMHDC